MEDDSSKEFLREYGDLRNKYKRDFISVPQFVPTDHGTWELKIIPQIVPVEEGIPSPFIAQ